MADEFDAWKTVFLGMQIVICVAGILLNGSVILAICKSTFSVSSTTYFILNIAVIEFLSCLLVVPFSIGNLLDGAWPFGVLGCQVYAFIIFLLALVSIIQLAAVSVGKYLTITKSLSKESYFSKKQVVLVIVACWVYCLLFSVAPLLGWSSYGLEGINTTCSIKWESNNDHHKAYFGLVFLACYLLPVGLTTFCYHRIQTVTNRLVTETLQTRNLFVVARQACLGLANKQRRSSLYFLVLVFAHLISWTPYAVVSFITLLGVRISPVAMSVPSIFAKISFILNPILYAFFSRKFRSRITVLFRKRRRFSSSVHAGNVNETLVL